MPLMTLSQATHFLILHFCGGMQVKMMTNHLACGPEVFVDIEATTTVNELKRKLEPLTGVPPKHQKIMLAGIGQITMGDKRCAFFAFI